MIRTIRLSGVFGQLLSYATRSSSRPSPLRPRSSRPVCVCVPLPPARLTLAVELLPPSGGPWVRHEVPSITFAGGGKAEVRLAPEGTVHGQIVDDLGNPTAEAVLARMKRFDAPAQRQG